MAPEIDPDQPRDETLADVAGQDASPEQCDCGPDEDCPVCVPCDICRDGGRECDCGGETDYAAQYVCCSGWSIPDHCCDCGGSPYCVECHTCKARCFGDCTCPATVQLESGATLTL